MDVAVRIVASAALLAAGFCVPASRAGDVNGDAVIDVLDVQRVFAAGAEGSADRVRYDLNNDGKVDILDMHIVLSNATYGQSGNRDAQDPPTPDATATVPAPQQFFSLLAPAPVLSRPVVETARSEAVLVWLACAAHPPSRTERYLFNLTPNAPPLPA